jgi:hypothetical protein
MEHELLLLLDEDIEEYRKRVVAHYRDGGSNEPLRMLVSNMPQKHQRAEEIACRIEKEVGRPMAREEMDMVFSSLGCYIKLSNVSLYLQRRWSGEAVCSLYERLFPGERDREMHRELCALGGDRRNKEEFSLDMGSLGEVGEEETKKMRVYYDFAMRVRSELGMRSVSPIFSAYKIAVMYQESPKYCSYELVALCRHGEAREAEVVGGMFLGAHIHPESRRYFCKMLMLLCQRERDLVPAIVHALLVAGLNERSVLREFAVECVPHIYLNLARMYPHVAEGRESGYPALVEDNFDSLLHLLDEKGAALVYEIFEEHVPDILQFRTICNPEKYPPKIPYMYLVQDLLGIVPSLKGEVSGERKRELDALQMKRREMYSLHEGRLPGDLSRDKMVLTDLFLCIAHSPTITHFLVGIAKHADLLRALEQTDLDELVYLIRSTSRSKAYQEILVGKLALLLEDK